MEACEGDYDTELLPGVARMLLDVIPAVVAMRYKISQQASRTFMRRLYKRISEEACLDDAVLDARRALTNVNAARAGSAYDRAFGTPVLYVRGSTALCSGLAQRPPLLPPEHTNQPEISARRNCPRCDAKNQSGRRCEVCLLNFRCPNGHELGEPLRAAFCGECDAKIERTPWTPDGSESAVAVDQAGSVLQLHVVGGDSPEPNDGFYGLGTSR